MLLVKSRELKSLGKKSPSNTWAYLSISPLVGASTEALAETQSLSNPTSILSIFLSLLLVVGIVIALALLMRRFNVAGSGHGQMKVVASLVAGSKERIMVIEVAGEQHLVGVTAHNINHLAKIENNLVEQKSASAVQFKDKLTQALAGKIQSSVTKVKEPHHG